MSAPTDRAHRAPPPAASSIPPTARTEARPARAPVPAAAPTTQDGGGAGARRSVADTVVMGAAFVAVWALVIAVGRFWGIGIEAEGRRLVLFTPPILGGYRSEHDAWFALPVATAAVLVAVLPAAAQRLRWRLTLLVGAIGSVLWWISLALVDGTIGLTRGLYWNDDYEPARALMVGDPRQFLATFTDLLPTYSIQLRAHPPGVPFLVALLDRIGLATESGMAVVTIVVAGSGVIAVLIAVREVAGEVAARRALPFLVLAPTATWMVITFDALFAGIAAWTVTLFVLATRRAGRRADLFAVAAGALAALTVLLSYGLVLMACVIVAVAITSRAWRPLIIATAVAMVAIVALVPLGFWWFTGLEGTRTEYYTLAVDRPYGYFLFNNVAAWFLAIGPATVVALAFLRDRRLWILVGGGLAAVVLADLSGLSNAEVERIWLPFTIWVLPAAAVLGGSRWATRGWLAAQAATAIVLAWFIGTHW